MSTKRLIAFGVTLKGRPITEVSLPKGLVDPGISYEASFEEWEAAREANLSLYDWYTGVYPTKFKARVLAWYRLHSLIKVHSDAAATPKVK